MTEVAEIPKNSCHWNTSTADAGTTVDDLITAVRTQESTRTSEPQQRDLDGRSGVYLELERAPGVDPTGCDGPGPVVFRDTEGGVLAVGNGQVQGLWVVDIDGRRGVIAWGSLQTMTDQTLAELGAAVDSLRITE